MVYRIEIMLLLKMTSWVEFLFYVFENKIFYNILKYQFLHLLNDEIANVHEITPLKTIHNF